ncbi:MAG: recombinase RecA [Caldisericia bacterium]|nr:recombinase RecA [Caldisericia bacterium]
MMADEKEKMLNITISDIEKRFGKGSIMKLGEKRELLDTEVISSGILTLDIALGAGGYPRGRIIEIFGQEGSGKSTVALEAVAEVQRQGGYAVYIDAEHALDPSYAEAIGVDLAKLYISQPDYAEQALEIAETLARSGAIDILVIDSVAALVPKTELEGEIGDQFMALQARLMSQTLRRLNTAISKSKTVAIFVNQVREKLGVMFGNPEVTPGGRALKFYSTIRIEIRKGDSIKEGETIIGTSVKAKVVKNKIAPPYKEAFFDIIYGKGVLKSGCIFDAAVELGIIEKSGTWYSYKGERISQGRKNVLEFFEKNPDLLKEIEKEVRKKVFPEKEEVKENK